eukprot:CAMPEP_0113314154 /NCGR_PEP_ID=MMETSP0010_2-20120614/10322_1 /TAXON_ID=216773 ORGANISM="Corethron hystrix, Strain 308" /NCGR_SAMPLE_ID=MMETSP0010_2 /ASSEMBLY_ACC=CAM_ASM_000155 /LENGTH=443 /DNA_ID=CAMNT_0000170371 /DNA_START=216 /DNA_END=1547 /DNA_ORIENTATION=- /assembly_acc=CAM_ASM_000155
MDMFNDRSKLPIRMTYRAVGSGTGQYEFIGEQNGFVPYNDFGAGDIPISTADYNKLVVDNNKEIIHVPFVIGAVNFFHSVSGFDVEDDEAGLNLSACTLAKIFKREIKTWNHEEIVKENPQMAGISQDIHVVHRMNGSSSTASITKFMAEACPDHWPADLVGKKITWPEDTYDADGSNQMAEKIRDLPGAIGYLDVGHGHAEALNEIRIENKAGVYLSSKEAKIKGGIGAPVLGALPSTADADHGEVDVLNEDGEITFPIVLVSYIYVRKDLSHLRTSTEKTLLKLFLKQLVNPDIIKTCEEFGFSGVPEGVVTNALNGIESLNTTGGPEWVYETVATTIKGAGAGDYVISEKRRTYGEYEREVSREYIHLLQESVFTEATMESEAPQKLEPESTGSGNAALVVSIVSIVIALVSLLYTHCKLSGLKENTVTFASNHKEVEAL